MSVLVWLLLFVPLVCFFVIVVPLWLVMHYVIQPRRAAKQRTQAEDQALSALYQQIDQMTERMIVIEQILDDRSTHWREEG